MKTYRTLLSAASASVFAALASDDASAGGSESARQSIVIQGYDFTISAPYTEGHVLTANEAAALNQLRAENVRNNSASRIKAAIKAAEEAGVEFSLDTSMVGEGDEAVTLRQSIEDYAENYEFGARRTSTREPVDPVQREALRIAKEVAATQLASKGIKQKDLAEGVYDELLGKILGMEKVQKLAAKRVKEREGLVGDEFDLGELATKPADEAPVEG